MERSTLTFYSGYMSEAWNPDAVLERAEAALANVDYDTLVGTGLSGALVVPQLARALGKHALIVRKPNDGSHSWHPVEGKLGRRWLFVDDFVDTGETRNRVRETVKNVTKARTFETKYAGTFLYNNGRYEAPKVQRYAVTETPLDTVREYLPNNYTANRMGTFSDRVLITGEDLAGWTLDYVIDRLASGLHFAREVDEGERDALLETAQANDEMTATELRGIAAPDF